MAEAARDRIAFAALRLAARTRIARGRPLPPLGPATYLTAIARVPADLGARLAGVATELPAPAGAFVYPPESIHFTVRNLNRLDGGDPAPLVAALAGGPFAVSLRGLGLSPTTVFAQVFAGPELGGLRARLDRLPPSARSLPLLGRLTFANVLRFSGRPPRALVAAVERGRRTGFSGFVVEELELVRTDRYLSAVATEVLARIPLR